MDVERFWLSIEYQDSAMNYDDVQTYFNRHCRIRLRSGKEVFGVLWEELSDTDKAIYFASYIEHKKRISRVHTELNPPPALRLSYEEIINIEQIDF